MARSFNGTSDLIAVTAAPFSSGSPTMTLSAFIKTSSSAAGAIIASDTGSSPNRVYQFTKTALNKLQFTVFATSVVHTITGATSVNDGLWHHVAAVNDGTTGWIYLDGVQDVTGAQAANHTLNLHNFRIGAQLVGVTGAFWNGSIAHAALWSSALTVSAAVSMSAGLPSSHLGPEHYYPLWGADSPEPDIGIQTHATGALTGTAAVNEARVSNGLVAFS